jgi:hypothetical protein
MSIWLVLLALGTTVILFAIIVIAITGRRGGEIEMVNGETVIPHSNWRPDHEIGDR